jgi:hypothetical protein
LEVESQVRRFFRGKEGMVSVVSDWSRDTIHGIHALVMGRIGDRDRRAARTINSKGDVKRKY